MFLNKFWTIPLILNLSLPLFLGQILNFVTSLYVLLIEVWLIKIWCYNIISIKRYAGINLTGYHPPPGWLPGH